MAGPSLPQHLLDKLKADPTLDASSSHIFKPPFAKFRFDTTKQNGISVETSVVRPCSDARTAAKSNKDILDDVLWDNVDTFVSPDKRTFLHFSAREADVPLAYEIIRLGANVDIKDQYGVTALFLALEHILVLVQTLRYVNQQTPSSFYKMAPADRASLKPDYIERRIASIARIATLCIEQHADVNIEALGHTPLSLAGEAGQWTLAELLLQHGARPLRIQDIKFASPADKKRFASLISKTKASEPRPAQPCPCWSGKLLAQCRDNGERHPYPDEYTCGCGKHKTYGECCGKRGIEVTEQWNWEERWIMRSTTRRIAPEGARGQEMLRNMDPDIFKQAMEVMKNDKVNYLKRMSRKAGIEDTIDPAYMYALALVDFFPRQWEKQLSLVEARKRMNEWNTGVDEYIATQGDARSRLDIELEAKIGMNGGPLYKYCEASGCDKREERDIAKMKGCGSCKMVFYCSQACQARGWKEGHKAECKLGKHQPQLLHSQRVMEVLMKSINDQVSVA